MNDGMRPDRVLPDGLLGSLDGFERETGSDDVLFLRGWILGNGSRVQSIVLKRANGKAIPIPYGLPRPDVGDLYPSDPHADRAGFGGQVVIDRTASSRLARRVLPERLDIFAVLEDGRQIQCFRRTFPARHAGVLLSVAARAAEFVRTAAVRAVAAYQEGRLSLSPGQWMNALRLQHEIAFHPRAASERFSRQTLDNLKETLETSHKARLQSFLDSSSRLSWPKHAAPQVSIILILFNRPEWTLNCLLSLQDLSLPVEIVIVDTDSTNQNSRLLDRFGGVKVLRLHGNWNLAHAWNVGADSAAGKHLLFLDPATEVWPGSLESAIETLESENDIGAVGAKVIFPDGRLKEAGAIVWRDGSCQSYGRNDAPQKPEYMYMRDVDYCSGIFLLTRREVFMQMNGFAEDDALTNGLDADYCFRLWKSGRRVVFEPSAVVQHLDFGDARLKPSNVLAERHANWIAHKCEPADGNLLEGRRAVHAGRKILVLDDRVPHFRHGAGFPRACELIRALDEGGHFVTVYPVTMPYEQWADVYEDIPRRIEVITGWGEARLHDFLKERAGYYDTIVVSRPHNMKAFRSYCRGETGWITNARIIYDAEAISAMRDAEQRRASGEQVSDSEVARLLSEEMDLAHDVHAVLSVTNRERDCFLSSGIEKVWTLGHSVALNPTVRPFAERSGVLFVGAMESIPNQDAVLWFCREIWPKLRSTIGDQSHFVVIGVNPPEEIRGIRGVEVLGQVTDLVPLYDRSRIFVAPNRLAAGIPIKVQTAAAHGVPVVCTSILADQLGWSDEVDLLVADDPETFTGCCTRLYFDHDLWQRLRTQALERVGQECSHRTFAATLDQALR